jgi:uncharacterized protein (TIGR02466 family)
MLEKIKYEKLFSTPMLRYQLSDHISLNAELIAEGNRLRALNSGVSKSNRGGWHSEGNLFESNALCIKKIHDAAIDSVFGITRQVTSKVDPESLRLKLFGWMNASSAEGFNAPHTHPGAHWSGVYYVGQPEVETGTSGMIEFLDPRSDLPSWRILKAQAFRPKIRFRPANGELIIFPSYLVHWVYPNEANEERVTIAFNATFRKPRLGADT